MKIDLAMLATKLADTVDAVKSAERLGYDGVYTAETSNDPFLPLVLAAEHTERVRLGTGIAVAFPRNPMQLANTAGDLHRYSHGRLVLGLGTQVRAHIEKRFGAVFDPPVQRMSEFIEALRAIWRCWNDGEHLAFRGEFYRHTLMTPAFEPGPNPYGTPPIHLAAVGPRMTRLAGEHADGLLLHGFSTERFVERVTMPALDVGLKQSGRSRRDVEISAPAFVVTGRDEQEYARSAAAMRAQIAFYGSTPAYRRVLELHGWGELQGELNGLSKQGRWSEMAGLIDDEALGTFAVCGEPGEIPERLVRRYGSHCDRITFYEPFEADPGRWADVLERTRRLSAA